jgi:hypothetical protein
MTFPVQRCIQCQAQFKRALESTKPKICKNCVALFKR